MTELEHIEHTRSHSLTHSHSLTIPAKACLHSEIYHTLLIYVYKYVCACVYSAVVKSYHFCFFTYRGIIIILPSLLFILRTYFLYSFHFISNEQDKSIQGEYLNFNRLCEKINQQMREETVTKVTIKSN